MSVVWFPRRRRLGRAVSFGLAVGLIWGVIPHVPAFAATTTYYLAGDSVPVASLKTTAPTATTLPNYDPGRDNLPGLVLQPTLFAGMFETDPTKYQRWSAAKGPVDIDGPVFLTVWSASDDFEDDERGTIRVGLYDCNDPGASCTLIAYDIHSADPWSPSGDWTEYTVGWSNVNYSVPAGHHLEIKIVTGITSETALLFAYDTVDYPSRLDVADGPPNLPPVAADDSASTGEDAGVVIDLLGNDTDPDGDAITVDSVTQPGNGSVVDNGDGTAAYTPDPDWNGTDTFDYTITDGTETDSATVTVTVAPVNDQPIANDDSATTAEDTAVIVNVLANDTDIDGDSLSVVAVTQPGNGVATDNGDGTITYAPPADWSGTAVFTYDLTDGSLTDTATVTVDIGASNDPPVAAPDTASVPEDGSVVVSVLLNDTDIDGDALFITTVSQPANGATTDNGDGTITYAPDADWNGTDLFIYEVTDGLETVQAEVTITVDPVNDAPSAGDISVSLVEDTTVTFDPVADANDIDGDPLSVSDVTQPANASVSLQGDGTLTITPDADWNGTTSFTYTVDDGAASATAAVSVEVTPANDAPYAAGDAATTDEDTVVLIDVLANDGDIDGDTIALSAVVDGGSGAATIESGAIRYAPAANWDGTDTLIYTITDGSLTTTGEIVVTVLPVNDAPVAGDDAVATNEDTPATFDVMANDSDVDGDELSLVSVGASGLGTAKIVSGKVRFTPNADANGTSSFSYTVSDPAGLTATATATVTVRPINDRPIAGSDAIAIDEDTSTRVNVLANDSDVDGDALAVSLASGPAVGAAVVNHDSTITYTPDPNWHGEVVLSYTVTDGVEVDTAPLVVTVRPVNDRPVAVSDSASVAEDGWLPLDPLENDSDVDGDQLAITAWTNPGHGRLALDSGVLAYTPDSDYFGSDVFSYTVSDGNGGFAAASVAVDVGAVDDVPEVRDDMASTPGGQAITIRVLRNDVDLDGDLLQILTFTQGDHGAVTDNGDGTLTYTPGAGFVGVDSFLYVVTDGTTPQSAQVTVTREIDGTALVETSLTPAPLSLAEWTAPPSTSDVVAAEVADTIATLAVPAAVTAAAAGGAMLSQSETAARILYRVGRLVLRRF